MARLGGDEFVVLTRHGEPDELDELARAVLGAVAVPVTIDGHQLAVTASIGVGRRAGRRLHRRPT